MKLRQFQTTPIINELRTFSYKTLVEGEEITVNVELFPDTMSEMANRLFLQREGDLQADDILKDYKAGIISASDIAGIIKATHIEKWKHWLIMWKAQYNPIWNVDGSETHTIITDYGKITTMAKNTSDATTYDSEVQTSYDSSSKTEYNSDETTEQLTDGKYNTTHGHVVEITEPQTDTAIAAYDSPVPVPYSETILTQHADTNSGTDQIAISDGKKKLEKGGYDEVSRDGSDTNTRSGTDTLTHTGSDTDTLSGRDTVTETIIKGGNIGVTMTQQLLTAEDTFWSKFSFFEKWFEDIAEELTLPIYE